MFATKQNRKPCEQRILNKKMEKIREAASCIARADVLIILAGAGASHDPPTNLPTFRDKEGFWENYPPAKKSGKDFTQYSNPRSFYDDARAAWGFFAYRYHMYVKAQPHEGYDILLNLAKRKQDYFVFTSNVDGLFQKAGFDEEKIMECHGSIHFVQARDPSITTSTILPATEIGIQNIELDEQFNVKNKVPTMSLLTKKKIKEEEEEEEEAIPTRPNILMFGDSNFVEDRYLKQQNKMNEFLQSIKEAKQQVAIIEIGAGLAVPRVRWTSEELQNKLGCKLIRINPLESQGPKGTTISISLGCLDAMKSIFSFISSSTT